ncbi:MAG: HpcH/HpaI aldolase family protein [Chloroflexota bacterium]
MAIVNKAKERLRAGKPIVGVGFTFASPTLIELCAYAGFHFVRIDCEHGPMDPAITEDLVRTAEAAGITPIVRPPFNSSHEILRYLDTGAQGVLVPHIETRADAEAAAKSARYFPQGERGMAGGRWSRYLTAGTLPDLIKQVNDAVLLMALVESKNGVDNLDEILAVPGIDAIQVGHNDLSQSLGLPALVNEPIVQEHINRIIDKSLAAGKYVGMLAADAAAAHKLLDRGVQIVEMTANKLFFDSSRAILKDLALD